MGDIKAIMCSFPEYLIFCPKIPTSISKQCRLHQIQAVVSFPSHLCGDSRAINTKQRKLESEVKVQKDTYEQSILLEYFIWVVVQKFYFSGKKTYIVGVLRKTSFKGKIYDNDCNMESAPFLITLQIHFNFLDWSGVRDG